MVRYKPSQFTKKELEQIVIVLATDQGIDFLTGGKLNKYKRKAAIAAYRAIVKPVAVRAAPSIARTALGMSRLALTNPYVVGGTLLYLGYTERDRIAQALADGAEIVEDPLRQYVGGVKQRTREFVAAPVAAVERGFETRRRFSEEFAAVPGEVLRKRKPSKFNKAVSAGMKVVKRAKRYGGKGKIKPAKSVFAMVTRIASAKKKKKKAPKSGIRRRIWNAMKGLR